MLELGMSLELGIFQGLGMLLELGFFSGAGNAAGIGTVAQGQLQQAQPRSRFVNVINLEVLLLPQVQLTSPSANP